MKPKKHVDLILNIDVITMQVDKPENLYMYMDYNNKKVSVFIDDEIPVKINIEKLAKKRLNIKDFWTDIIDVTLRPDYEKRELLIRYFYSPLAYK